MRRKPRSGDFVETGFDRAFGRREKKAKSLRHLGVGVPPGRADKSSSTSRADEVSSLARSMRVRQAAQEFSVQPDKGQQNHHKRVPERLIAISLTHTSRYLHFTYRIGAITKINPPVELR
uniref:Uncharacterized protein n=1 Tax=Kalanchoe fedtschenkoi TaxID=63787 RepID=A0A7N0UNB1_KALFE